MSKKKTDKKNKKSSASNSFGFSVAIGFSITALYIAFSPRLFVNPYIRFWTMWITIIFALGGTLIELGKSMKLYFSKEIDLSYLFLGIFLLFLFYVMRDFTFNHDILDSIYDFIVVFTLLLGVTSAIDGLLKIIQELKYMNITQALKKSIGKTFTVIINIAGLLASLVAILQAMKLIN